MLHQLMYEGPAVAIPQMAEPFRLCYTEKSIHTGNRVTSVGETIIYSDD
jgi:hypothetical protein